MFDTYRRSKVVPHFMRHSHMGDRRRDMLAIVHQGYDPGVQTLEATSVVLKNDQDTFKLLYYWMHSYYEGHKVIRDCKQN